MAVGIAMMTAGLWRVGVAQMRGEASNNISIIGDCVHFVVDGASVWSLAVCDIRIIAECTVQADPIRDDYFVVFLDSRMREYVVPTTAPGLLAAIDVLQERLKCQMQFGLANSTVLASRILWPDDLQGAPLFDDETGTDQSDRASGELAIHPTALRYLQECR